LVSHGVGINPEPVSLEDAFGFSAIPFFFKVSRTVVLGIPVLSLKS
jgi:hypothetical protein